jgi:hypothetical protein
MILDITKIRTDGGTQVRAVIDQDVVQTYADAMREHAKFPHITVFHDGAEYWLADGFHRLEALKLLGKDIAVVDAIQGSLREAILFSVGANAKHGLRRTNDDKRRAIETLLRDEEWRTWNDERVAERCGVGRVTVNRVRSEMYPKKTVASAPVLRHTRNGKVMDVSNIGKTQPKLRPLTAEEKQLLESVQNPSLYVVEYRDRVKVGWSAYPVYAVQKLLAEIPDGRLVILAHAPRMADKRKVNALLECDQEPGGWYISSQKDVAEAIASSGMTPVRVEPTCINYTSCPPVGEARPAGPQRRPSPRTTADEAPNAASEKRSQPSANASKAENQSGIDDGSSEVAWIEELIERLLNERLGVLVSLRERLVHVYEERGLSFETGGR